MFTYDLNQGDYILDWTGYRNKSSGSMMKVLEVNEQTLVLEKVAGQLPGERVIYTSAYAHTMSYAHQDFELFQKGLALIDELKRLIPSVDAHLCKLMREMDMNDNESVIHYLEVCLNNSKHHEHLLGDILEELTSYVQVNVQVE